MVYLSHDTQKYLIKFQNWICVIFCTYKVFKNSKKYMVGLDYMLQNIMDGLLHGKTSCFLKIKLAINF
jgi:hypothetical protein